MCFKIAVLLTTCWFQSYGQLNYTFLDNAKLYFDEVKEATEKHTQLWGKNLYGPILLVDKETRQVYANFSDSYGVLHSIEKVYTGILPNDVTIANTAVTWGGKVWAMVMLPLPENNYDRVNLLSHELFHVSQSSLGFGQFNPENNHLDLREGRIYLRLELEALRKAIVSTNEVERNTHIKNALSFRSYRHQLFPKADSTENLLELNEGLAEYTGVILSGRNPEMTYNHLLTGISEFSNNPTFVRSFAYQTLPTYGYLLHQKLPGWIKSVSGKTNITRYFIQAFGFTLSSDLKSKTDSILSEYKGNEIIAEEIKREQKNIQMNIMLKKKFVTDPHLSVELENMSVSFDPTRIVPLDGMGAVYSNIKIIDKWGVLTVQDEALLSPDWDKVTITIPVSIENDIVKGTGWTLELSQDYLIVKDSSSGSFTIKRK